MPQQASVTLQHHQGGIAILTLNNPERLNALTLETWSTLGERIVELDADDQLRAIVIRGAGTKAFAAGADISEFPKERSSVVQARKYGRIIDRTMQAIRNARHPTIAMIHGVCVGGGLEVAAMCDLRICGESSRFGVPVKNLGLVMGYGELAGLIDLVGRAVALEIVLEGRVFDAHEAVAKGLVTRVVPDAQVEREALDTAERIAAGAPLVARWHKKFARRLASPEPLSDQEYDESFACFGTNDFRTGFSAFLSKQKPEFTGT